MAQHTEQFEEFNKGTIYRGEAGGQEPQDDCSSAAVHLHPEA